MTTPEGGRGKSLSSPRRTSFIHIVTVETRFAVYSNAWNSLGASPDRWNALTTWCLHPPPSEHRLSDALVFLIIGQNAVAKRNHHGKWPADFNSDGDVYPDRWPMGEPVFLWAHDNLTHDGFHFGEIIANPAKLNTLDAKRALQIDCDTYDWSNFAKKPSLRGAINRLIMTYYNSALPVSNGTPG
ncbi:unnamed protein product [Penicillium camemberti]|uniref:Str. FM013 n=1 Tax=Penicillium camemberti (strain FM 013) TaxID=1429867 RepID=A0A0G4PHL3_PENC3|nr:unnamed protein product [Penicillium camemberti]